MDLSPAAAAGYPAIQLFMHRAASSAVGLEFTDTNLGQVIDICRRLDGIPLALELAAAAVGMLGVRGVAQRLTEQLALPSRGRRTVLARQATLSTMLNWSYRLLAPAEQRALRRLAIFRGGFSLDSAVAARQPTAKRPCWRCSPAWRRSPWSRSNSAGTKPATD
jgi:predicted ATPase